MTFRWFLLVMTIATLAMWVAWLFVLHTIDPLQSGLTGFVLFYLTLFVALLGTTVLSGSLIRSWVHPDELLYRQTLRSFRQGFILSGLFICSLWLFAFEAMRWWTILLLIILFSLIELFFVSKQSKRSN